MLAVHRWRLRELWRSAGWPCHDAVELELLAAGMLSRHWDEEGRETLRLTDAGLQVLAVARQSNQAAFEAHAEPALDNDQPLLEPGEPEKPAASAQSKLQPPEPPPR